MSQFQDDPPARRIGVAVNNSAASAAALEWACDEASRTAAELVVASVVSLASDGPRRSREPAGESGDEIVARIVARCPAASFRIHVVDAMPAGMATALTAALATCDLLVIGSPDSPDHRMLAFDMARLTGCRVVEVDPTGVAVTVRTDGLLLDR